MLHIRSFGALKHTGAIQEDQVSEERDSEMVEDGVQLNSYLFNGIAAALKTAGIGTIV